MQGQERVSLDYMKVKYYCRKKNWTMSRLACELGVTRQTVRSWCVKPTARYNCWMLQDILEVEENELLLSM